MESQDKLRVEHNRNFLTRSFKVVKDDETQIQGTQVIGYSHVNNVFKCWVFHSGGGGFGEGAIAFGTINTSSSPVAVILRGQNLATTPYTAARKESGRSTRSVT